MRLRYKLLAGAAVLAAAFAWGRLSAPLQVKEVERIRVVTVEKRAERKDVVTTTTQRPDGTTVTETRDRSVTDTDTNVASATDRERTATYRKPDWSVTALVGTDLRDVSGSVSNISVPLVFGVEVQRRVLGPIHVSGWFLTNKTVGVGLGVTF